MASEKAGPWAHEDGEVGGLLKSYQPQLLSSSVN